jgi:hypothetical protein
MVKDVFDRKAVSRLIGSMGIGHGALGCGIFVTPHWG